MSSRALPALLLSVLFLTAAPIAARSEVLVSDRPDDEITMPLSVEGWVVSKTARVTVNVSLAVDGSKAGSAREAMGKAVQNLAQGEWRQTSFGRSQDNTGLEHWDVQFETRLQESALGGIHDRAKSASKAGMQVAVVSIDFSPTLDEMEAAKLDLRRKLYARAQQELEAANSGLTGRAYRVSELSFDGSGNGGVLPYQHRMMMKAVRAMADNASGEAAPMMAASAPAAAPGMDMSTSMRITMNATLVLKALAPSAAAK